MRGKKPKERKCYILRMGDGTLIEVTREIYLEWYQSRRRERYQQEQKQKYGVCSLEETAMKKICVDKLKTVMANLPEEDMYLLYLLFFEEVSVKEAAQLCGCSRKTIENRRKRILKGLNAEMLSLVNSTLEKMEHISDEEFSGIDLEPHRQEPMEDE